MIAMIMKVILKIRSLDDGEEDCDMVMIISLDHGDDDYNLTSTGEDWVVLVRGNFLQLFLFSPIKLFLFPPSYITNHPPKAFHRFSFFADDKLKVFTPKAGSRQYP